jgi:predicted phosphoribosyltransferase
MNQTPPTPMFVDRTEAGVALAVALRRWPAVVGSGSVVLGLPRGGVPVAAPVAAALVAPLDVLLVRKLGLPDQPELAMGAIAAVAGHRELVTNPMVLLGVDPGAVAFVLARETTLLEEQERQFRAGPPLDVTDRTVVVVDDGLATGATMRAAVAALRHRSPARIVVAVPVGAPSTCRAIEQEVDQLVCLQQPRHFRAVGEAYVDFSPTTDDEVRALLGL